jgi:predicted Kef-type K+ transport protein
VIGTVLLLAAVAGALLRRVGLLAIVGYMAVGLLVSPFTPGYGVDREQLQLFADIDVVASISLAAIVVRRRPWQLERASAM